MFAKSKFNGDISKWDVINVTNMEMMFSGSQFNKKINEWKVYSLQEKDDIFKDSEIEIPYWYKDYKEDDNERKEQIEKYHLSKKIEKSILVKNNKPSKI
jgi:surface protein